MKGRKKETAVNFIYPFTSHLQEKDSFLEMNWLWAKQDKFRTPGVLLINKSTNNNCWQGCKNMEPQYTVGRNAEWHSHYGKRYGGSSEN